MSIVMSQQENMCFWGKQFHIFYRNCEHIYFGFHTACVYLPSPSCSSLHLARMFSEVKVFLLILETHGSR